MIDQKNKYLVGIVEDTIVIPGLTPQRLSFDDAVNLAAWLVGFADGHRGDFETVRTLDGYVAELSRDFLELLAKVQHS